MRIGIDARLGGAKHAGIGRYIEELLRGLTSLQAPHTWVVFVESKQQFPWLPESLAAVQGRVEVRTVPIRHYTLREQLLLPPLFAAAKLDILHVPHFNVPLLFAGKLVVTIHDLLWHEVKDHRATTLPPWLHALKHRAYKRVAEHAIQHAQTVIVPSAVVKKKLNALIPKANVEVVYEGVTPISPAKTFRLASLRKPYLVYVGSLYPHKNVESVLKALKLLPQYTFCVCSSRSVFSQQFIDSAKKIGVQEQLRMLGYVEDADVSALQEHAVALIQPSTSEGFGLTGLEALANGTPVLASDIPVFHEIYGDLAAFVDTSSARAMADALVQLEQKQDSWRKKIAAAKEDLLKKYSWKKMAQETLRIYESKA